MKKNDELSIIGIGASAGGLEALELFFKNIPELCNMAFIVIQHLDPASPGLMPELLQKITKLKVFKIEDGISVEPNCVYAIPPNKSLSILNGALHLFEPIETNGLRLPIDFFFRSLAEDRLNRSIGVILSGMGSDGSVGIKAIKEKNGLVLVQEPSTAKFDSMPMSAIHAVNADIVAPADELAAKLIQFLKSSPADIDKLKIENIDSSILNKIIILLRDQTGHDFSQYKQNTLLRRIERRQGIHQLDSTNEYVHFLQENPQEVEILFKELLIGVTNFFRDPTVWETLKEKVLPELLNELPSGYTLRAWVTACSTGEEAYSLAIIFKEALQLLKDKKHFLLQIFATDIDSNAIDAARKGEFSKNIAADVSEERLKNYFTPNTDNFRINADIREMIVFAPQNIIKDPPFTKLDLLFCRNMLIYMTPELQDKLFSLFHYSLNSGGILLLGNSETLRNKNDGFENVDINLKFFKRTHNPGIRHLINFPSSFSPPSRAVPIDNVQQKELTNIQSLIEVLLLQQFAPASILVNTLGDIINITGHTGKYLEPSTGKSNFNIHAMAKQGLRKELPTAFKNAKKLSVPVKLNNVKIINDEIALYVDVTIQYLEKPEAIKGMILIVFSDTQKIVKNTEISKFLKTLHTTGSYKEREMQLELELLRSNENLQNLREEMQTSEEELKSTNEELQSANEELTTSKEEMQSLNEELQTLNSELQIKVTDFVQVSSDMRNLLNSIGIATLFLDKDLNIRRFTDLTISIIKLRNSDIGRPFTDIVNNLLYPELKEDAKKVLSSVTPIEKAIKTNDNRWFNTRLMPYQTAENLTDGLVITFTDITEFKK